MSCTSSNLIYVIICAVCGEIILGRRDTPSDTEWLSIDNKSENQSTKVFSLLRILETVDKNSNLP